MKQYNPVLLLFFVLSLTSFNCQAVQKEKTKMQPDDQQVLLKKQLKNSFQKQKKLYDLSKYDECIDECDKIIKNSGKSVKTPENCKFLANFYELKADSFHRLKKTEKAVLVLNKLLKTDFAVKLPQDYIASVKLKIGNMYRQAGLYSQALTQYHLVVKEYKTIFPDRFVKYAKENIKQLEAEKVATVTASVVSSESKPCRQADISIFNGFQTIFGKTDDKGKCTMPLFKSTSNTYLVICASKPGYKPAIVSQKFTGKKTEDLPPLKLTGDSKKQSYFTGSAYRLVTGGKLKPVNGIESLSKGIKITLKDSSGKEIKVETDQNGLFSIPVPAGKYQLKAPGQDKSYSINDGQVIFVNLMMPGMTLDKSFKPLINIRRKK